MTELEFWQNMNCEEDWNVEIDLNCEEDFNCEGNSNCDNRIFKVSKKFMSWKLCDTKQIWQFCEKEKKQRWGTEKIVSKKITIQIW